MEDPHSRKAELNAFHNGWQASHQRKKVVESPPKQHGTDGTVFFDGATSPLHKRQGYGLEHLHEIPIEAEQAHRQHMEKKDAMRVVNQQLVASRTVEKCRQRAQEITTDQVHWKMDDPWGKPGVGVAKRTETGQIQATRLNAVAGGRHYTDGPTDSYVAQHFGKGVVPNGANHGRRANLFHNQHHSEGPGDSYSAMNFGRAPQHQSPVINKVASPVYGCVAEVFGAAPPPPPQARISPPRNLRYQPSPFD